MKKMFLMLAIMALATGAFAAWDAGVTQGTEASAGFAAADMVGDETSPVTIYAKFTIAGPEFQVNGGLAATWDTWTVVDFMPGDYGWADSKFDIQNTGGVTLDIGLHQTAEAADVTIEAVAVAYDAAWVAATDSYRMWAVIVGNGSAAPAAGTDMTVANYLATGAVAWYADAAYMVPSAGAYTHVDGTGLNLWAADAGAGDDEVDLWLGFSASVYGWTILDAQTVTMAVSCQLSTT